MLPVLVCVLLKLFLAIKKAAVPSVCTHTHAHAHTHMHTHIHTHTQTNTNTNTSVPCIK